jgi:hypothetical protein
MKGKRVIVLLGAVACAFLGTGLSGSQPGDQTGESGRVNMTLISAAMTNDNDGVVRMLRDGADPNIVDESGRTPLMWAAIHNNEATLRALLRAGADPSVQDMEGHTASWHSMRRTVHFTLPLQRGLHGTIFLPRLFATRTQRVLAASAVPKRP